MTDLKYAVRQLLKNPGFTAVAVLTLGLCLGANLTILTVVDAILVRALPFREPERLAVVYNSYPRAGVNRVGCSLPNYFDRRGGGVRAFESVSVYQEASVIVEEAGNPGRVPILRVTPEFFSTLGVPLALGQPFTEGQLAYGTDEEAILTDEFWRGHFHGDPGVLGRTFLNDGLRISVIGVLPRGFRFLSSRAQFFRPASHAPDDRLPANRHSSNWNMIARLAPGTAWPQAQSELDQFNGRQALDDPSAEVIRSTGFRSFVRPLHEDHVSQVKGTLMLLQAGVLVLLTIGLVNLANLLLIRTNGRAQELAVREALGAGRWRAARGVVAEVLVIVVLGAVLAVGLASAGLQVLNALGADRLPLGAAIGLSGRIEAAAFVAALAVGAILALLLAGFHSRMRPAGGLLPGSRGGTAGPGTQRLHHAFVIAQVALAFVLLSGAGLLGLSLKRVLEAPPGFNPANVLTGRLAFPWKTYQNQPSRLAFVDRLVAAVRALPGVTQVAVTTGLPFGGDPHENGFAVEGYAPASGAKLRGHYLATVTGDYWRAMGIPLLRGRYLEDADRHREPRACVVDKAVADLYWPGSDPIGKRIANGDRFTEEDAAVVVGVVGGVKHLDLAEASGHGAVYLPYGRLWPDSFSLVVRTEAPLAAVERMLRGAVQQVDPGMPLDDLRPLQSRIDDSLVARRSPAILAGGFAAVALLLSALGTYGVLAYAVSCRQREIGVRLALGAQPVQVLGQFLRTGARLCLTGMAFGLVGAYLAGRAAQSVLFGVGAFHVGVILATGLGLGIVVLLASLIPSRRAARTDPMEALRCE